MDAFQNSTVTNLAPFITSEVGGHNLAPTVFVAVDCCMALAYLFADKLLYVCNRFYVHVVGAVLATAGLAVLAASRSLAVYAAGNLLYSVGWAAASTAANSLLLETTTMTHVGLVRAFNASPGLIAALAGSPIADRFTRMHWRWCYSSLAAMLPLVALLVAMFLWFHWGHRVPGESPSGERRGQDPGAPEPSGAHAGFRHPLTAHDYAGAGLFTGGSALLLVSFSLAGIASHSWRSPHIVGMIVGGCASLTASVAVARWVARVPFVPVDQLRHRAILGVCRIVLSSSGEGFSPLTYADGQSPFVPGRATSPRTCRSCSASQCATPDGSPPSPRAWKPLL